MALNSQPEAALVGALGGRCIVLIGMMGSGKTSVGRPLAARLGLDFADADADADAEIKAEHRMRFCRNKAVGYDVRHKMND